MKIKVIIHFWNIVWFLAGFFIYHFIGKWAWEITIKSGIAK